MRREVAALQIRYAVLTDNDYATWNAYKVEGWPTMFLLDKSGHVRWMHVGEGAYDEAEQTIQKLLAEEALPQKAILSLLEANKALGTEPRAVASGIKTQAEI